ncbi:hypothetical protein XH89_19490 [Bradyrhizobium sp. CCBAU 53340]|nr:hypothetical protein XH89_19490 [Bradyrhizobium sp. CCBAU 53340]
MPHLSAGSLRPFVAHHPFHKGAVFMQIKPALVDSLSNASSELGARRLAGAFDRNGSLIF